MAAPVLESAFLSGELAPSLYGRVDTARYHNSAATLRNMFCSYRGGAYSRAGTAFIGYSRQTGRNYPPRLIPFQFSINQGLVLEWGHLYMRVIQNGAYVTEAPETVNSIAASGAVTVPNHGYATGDWIYFAGGPSTIAGQTFVATVVGPNVFTLADVFGNAITLPAAYAGTATAARIYTLSSPYAETDLPYLKFVQSADVMSLCCVNQVTETEYPPYDLARVSNANWTLTQITFGSSIAAPGTVTGISSQKSASQGTTTTTGSAGGTATTTLPMTTFYQYQVTAISTVDGSESVPSPICYINNALDMAATAASNKLTWATVPNAASYNIYQAQPGYSEHVPSGAQFGFVGSSYGGAFICTNVQPDYSQVPPVHKNPFARGALTGVIVTAQGSAYDNGSTGFTVNTTTGSGAVLEAVADEDGQGALLSVIVVNGGQNYAPTDTITVTSANNGSGATVSPQIGPQTGTYPSVPAYFQQRRVYGNTLNNPDTYYMSQPGSYLNFDSRIPTIDQDAITGTPWSLQVNGIQHLVSMPGGLLCLTGLGAWQVTGAGSYGANAQPITPSSQQAQPQAYNGISPTVPPVKIDFDVLYVQAKGSIIRDISYDFFKNIYTGADLTANSSHLFTGYTMKEMAYTEEPHKVMWVVRNDGVLLSLTYLKTEQVAGWARHDTLGNFVSVASVVEPPVDALYVATQRFINGMFPFMIERMDDRIWPGVEQTWCVDAGLSLAQPAPAAQLQASSATGNGAISSMINLIGGSGYSPATTVTVVDANGAGPGSGCTLVPTIVNGVITAVGIASEGQGYVSPSFVIADPAGTGQGASVSCVLDNSATFTANAPIFSASSVGQVIRMGGGIATITQVLSATQVIANITTPITATRPNTSPPQVTRQAPGKWSLTAPASTITGLGYLAGSTVTGLADGQVITPRTVSAQGTIMLDAPASAVTVGLGFQCQFQSVFLDSGEPTIQGQRKKVGAATIRLEASCGVKTGANQPDGPALSPPQLAPTWSDLTAAPDLIAPPFAGGAVPLWTGDVRVDLPGGWNKHGQVALQQDNPLPMQILAVIPEVLAGDTPSQMFPKRQQAQGR